MTFGGKKRNKVYSRNHSLRSRGDRPVAPTAQFGKSQIQNPDCAASGYIRAATLNVGSLEIRRVFDPMEWHLSIQWFQIKVFFSSPVFSFIQSFNDRP